MTENQKSTIDGAASRWLNKKLNRSQILKAAGIGVAAAAVPRIVSAQSVSTTAATSISSVNGATFPFFPVTNSTYTTESMETILNVAQTMEYLAVTLVNAAVMNAGAMGITGVSLQALQAALAEEAYHVEFLTSMGGTPMTTTFTVPDSAALSNATAFFRTLEVLESIFVAAYMTATREFAELGQPLLTKFGYQTGAVEAEHRAVARTALALMGATTGAGTATPTATALPTSTPTAAATDTATAIASGTAAATATAVASALRAHQTTGAASTPTSAAAGGATPTGATPSGVGTTPALSPFSGVAGSRAPIIAGPIPPDNKAFETDLFLYVADAASLLKGLGFIGGTGTSLTYPGEKTALANSGAAGAAVVQKLPNNATVSIVPSDVIGDISAAGLTGLVASQPSLGTPASKSPTATSTPAATNTPAATSTPAPTNTATATSTPVPTSTGTITATPGTTPTAVK
jgi:hypothetical protein